MARIHHSELPFKQLRSMKNTDRNSCTVTVLRKELASPALLSQARFLGQFGEIVLIRVLLDTPNQRQVFVRFAQPGSAARAIAWCDAQPSLFASAAHGYSKYCVRFLNGQKCLKRHCRNRHSWMDDPFVSASDAQAVQAQQAQQARASSNCGANGPCSDDQPPIAKNIGESSAAIVSANPMPRFESAATAAMQRQRAYIAQLEATVKALTVENACLKREVHDLLFESEMNRALPTIVDEVFNDEFGLSLEASSSPSCPSTSAATYTSYRGPAAPAFTL